jgi:hypothetical protein
MGLRHEQICMLVKVRSPKTLRKYFRSELDGGTAEAEAAVTRTAYEMATSGKCLAMTLFWDKCQRSVVEEQERQEEQQEREQALQQSRAPKILFRVPRERRDAA